MKGRVISKSPSKPSKGTGSRVCRREGRGVVTDRIGTRGNGSDRIDSSTGRDGTGRDVTTRRRRKDSRPSVHPSAEEEIGLILSTDYRYLLLVSEPIS
jgi:hypothetical protein